MNTRVFYYFAIALCILLASILLFVTYRGYQKAVPTERKPGAVPERKLGAVPERKPGAVPPITAFQFITNKLNKMGVTTNGVEIDINSGTVKWSPKSKWGEYYGKPSSESEAIAPMIMQLHHTIKANPQGIRGCYQTKWGLLRLYIKDDVVTGTLNYFGPVHIIGKLKDNILVGVWIKPAHNNSPMLVGPMQFAFSKNWSAFRSVWKYKKAPQFNNKWVGTKIKCPARGTKLPQNLVTGGPGVPEKTKPGQAKPGQAKPGGPAGGKMPQRTPPPPAKQ